MNRTTAIFLLLPVLSGASASVIGCDGAAEDEDGRPELGSSDEMSVESARANLDALYKGDYRSAFVEKDPELFLHHIADEFSATMIDGTKGNALALREFFPVMIQGIDRVIDHNVTIEDVRVDGGRIEAVVTLTTVIDRRSPAGIVYNEVSVGTYLDKFVRDSSSGELMEVGSEQVRLSVSDAPRP